MPIAAPQSAGSRIDRIRDPARPACRDDLIWLLHAVKKKVADGAPALQELPRPQLISALPRFRRGGAGAASRPDLHRR